MSGPVQTLASGVVDGVSVPAVAKVSPNVRARTATDFIGTVGDVVTFAGVVPPFTIIGNWVSPNARVLAAGLPTISVSSVGTCFNPVGVPTGPMRVLVPDPRVQAS